MLKLLLDLPLRKIFYIDQSEKPACFLIADKKGGGILVNTPPYSTQLLEEIEHVTKLNYLFLPSKFGAQFLCDWHKHTTIESISHENEEKSIQEMNAVINIPINHKSKLTRTIDFVPMAGRTNGSCALFLKNKPGILFLGPILSNGKNGWPTLIQNIDDKSFETRMFGSLGLKDLKFEYIFLDDFDMTHSKFGPAADVNVIKNINHAFE